MGRIKNKPNAANNKSKCSKQQVESDVHGHCVLLLRAAVAVAGGGGDGDDDDEDEGSRTAA